MATSACTVRVRGVVQGVGFRPFVYRLARANTLAGWVLNGEGSVEIRVEGPRESLDAFLRALRTGAPAAARITDIAVTVAEPSGLEDFTIEASRSGPRPSASIALGRTSRIRSHPIASGWNARTTLPSTSAWAAAWAPRTRCGSS